MSSLGQHLSSLPTDIARIILETAAKSDRQNAIEWTLVSKTVRIWMDPILYHTVVLANPSHTHNFMYTLATRGSAFMSRVVKVLICARRAAAEYYAIPLLSACRNIVSLALYWDDVDQDLEINRLINSAPCLRRFYPFRNITPLPLPLTNPTLTHLAYNLFSFGEMAFHRLSAMASVSLQLTHILLNLEYPGDGPFDTGLADLRVIQTSLPTLKVLVLNFIIIPVVLNPSELKRLLDTAHSLRREPPLEVVLLHLDCERYMPDESKAALPPPRCYLPDYDKRYLREDEIDVWEFVDKVVSERPASARRYPDIINASRFVDVGLYDPGQFDFGDIVIQWGELLPVAQ